MVKIQGGPGIYIFIYLFFHFSPTTERSGLREEPKERLRCVGVHGLRGYMVLVWCEIEYFRSEKGNF